MRQRTASAVRTARAALALAFCLTLASCAINPATGQRQIMLVSESQEIQIGKDNDQAVTAQFGLYEDDDLQRYVAELGRSLAARSERPDLDWTFRVLDDTVVNAFALPGGYIYVTRGILAHLDDEAELASVLGHEIGHVTARHGANQMSKAQLAQLGLGVGAAVTPERLQRLMNVAGLGLELLFLKYSRDDERQADDLGLRYLVKGGYDPRPMGNVFATLKRVSLAQSQERAPSWLSTHPDPENREARIEQQIADLHTDFSVRPTRRDAYLAKIDGIVYGDDPRHGYFRENVFYHPEMRFRLDFPSGWKLANGRQSVSGASPEQDAVLELSLVDATGAETALGKFLEQEGVSGGNPWKRTVNGLAAAGSGFQAALSQGTAPGEIVFVEYGGRVFQLLGLAREASWGERRPALQTALAGFRPLTDPRMLDVQPRRLAIVRPDRPLSPAQFAERYAATVPADTLAILNEMGAGERYEGGRPYKVVQGGKLP
jgi:predicted Zn-dependent protease